MYYSDESLFEFSFSYERHWSCDVFLGIEVTRSLKGLSLPQRKYLTDLLEETGTLGSKPIDTPMDANICFDQNLEKSLVDLGKYN